MMNVQSVTNLAIPTILDPFPIWNCAAPSKRDMTMQACPNLAYHALCHAVIDQGKASARSASVHRR